MTIWKNLDDYFNQHRDSCLSITDIELFFIPDIEVYFFEYLSSNLYKRMINGELV
jgi:hypothetical protein